MKERALRRLIGLTVGVWVVALAVPAVAAESNVSIGSFKFAPATATVEQGDTVTWSWAGPDINHTVTSDPGQADTLESHPGLAIGQVAGPPPGGTYSHTFNTPGTFTYFCRVHTSMKGKVVVNPAAAPSPSPSSGQSAAPAGSQGNAGAGHPTFKECLSQRNFIIQLRELGGVHLRSATVIVNGKPASVMARMIAGHRRLTARVDLRGLPSGQYAVNIEARTTKGRTLRGRRLYTTCAKKAASYVLPKL